MTTAYLAADGHTGRLQHELARGGVTVGQMHGRLLITPNDPIDAAWSANTWYDVETLPITSIGDAAHRLRQRQRSWAPYAPEHRGRIALIEAKLPPLSQRSLNLGEPAPASPLGSFTLIDPNTMLAATRCSSAFPNGEVPLSELKVGPPNRAYRKLWESFVVLGEFPRDSELAVDLGASPGGWTWLLARLGCEVIAVDKAPLDRDVASLEGVTTILGSAFAVDPEQIAATGPPVRWVCSDIACYPRRLLPMIDRWRAVSPAPTLIFTLKFQGETDHVTTDRFRAIPGARVIHLHHNKHELTFLLPGDRN